MASSLDFQSFMQEKRVRSLADEPKQLALNGIHPEEIKDVGAVRLSRIEAAMKEARAARTDE